MTDLQGKKCKKHPGKFIHCSCDEERDRKANIHRCSGLDDGLGGYMCVCLRGRYGLNGCMAPPEGVPTPYDHLLEEFDSSEL